MNEQSPLFKNKKKREKKPGIDGMGVWTVSEFLNPPRGHQEKI